MGKLVLDPRLAAGGRGDRAQDARRRAAQRLRQRLHRRLVTADVGAQVGRRVAADHSGGRHQEAQRVGGKALLARRQGGHRGVQMGGEDPRRPSERGQGGAAQRRAARADVGIPQATHRERQDGRVDECGRAGAVGAAVGAARFSGAVEPAELVEYLLGESRLERHLATDLALAHPRVVALDRAHDRLAGGIAPERPEAQRVAQQIRDTPLEAVQVGQPVAAHRDQHPHEHLALIH